MLPWLLFHYKTHDEPVDPVNIWYLILGFPTEILSWPRNEQKVHAHTRGFQGFSWTWSENQKWRNKVEYESSKLFPWDGLGTNQLKCCTTNPWKKNWAGQLTGQRRTQWARLLAGIERPRAKGLSSPGSSGGRRGCEGQCVTDRCYVLCRVFSISPSHPLLHQWGMLCMFSGCAAEAAQQHCVLDTVKNGI